MKINRAKKCVSEMKDLLTCRSVSKILGMESLRKVLENYSSTLGNWMKIPLKIGKEQG